MPRGCGVLIAVAVGLSLPVLGIAAGVATHSVQGFAIGFLVPVVVIGAGAVLLEAVRRDRVRRQGILTSATIVSVSPIHFQAGMKPLYDITYRFVDQEGKEHVATSRLNKTMPRGEEPHTIRYDPAEPRRSIWIS